MEHINEVHAALARIKALSEQGRDGAAIVSTDASLPEDDEPRGERKSEALDLRSVASQEDRDADEKRGLLERLIQPFVNIRELIAELSPSGLRERGIPFTSALEMPRSVLTASVVINLFGLALPLVILQVYDRIIPNQALDTFTLLMVGLLVVVFFEGILRVLRAYVISWAATRFTQAITQDLTRRFINAPTNAFMDTPSATIIEKMSNINQIAEFYGGQSRLMFIDLPFAFLFLFFVGLIGGWLVIVPVVILCLFGIATIAASQAYKRVLEEKEGHEARTYDFVVETLGGILTLKSQSAESLLLRRFERLQATNAKLHYAIITAAMQGQSIASLLGNGTMIAMVSTGALLAIQGQMTVGVLACCSLLAGRAVQPILRVAGTWNEFQRARLSISEVAKLFELGEAPSGIKTTRDPPTPSIRAKNATLLLPKTDKKVIDVNFHIDPGEVIAVVAEDGAGSSTLLDTVAGLRRPSEGAILLDDMPASDFRTSYRGSVAASSSRSELFEGSIFDNLSLFGQGQSAEDLRWAAKMIDLEREIDRLPEGYDTMLGKGIAETLPSGLVGRILIARVLAQKPVLWVLDEPEDMLDLKGQESLRSVIVNLREWITFMYTTRSADLIAVADRVLVLDAGRIQEFQGSAEFYEAIEQGLVSASLLNASSRPFKTRSTMSA